MLKSWQNITSIVIVGIVLLLPTAGIVGHAEAAVGDYLYSIGAEYPIHTGLIAIDSSGNIITAFEDGEPIQKFDPEGRLLNSWGGPCPVSTGSCDGYFAQIFGLGADLMDNVYIIDYRGIQIYSADGVFLRRWNISEEIHGVPYLITADKNGNIVVVSAYSEGVRVIDTFDSIEGNVVYEWYTSLSPRSIATDEDNNIYLLDSEPATVSVFSPDGTFIKSWESPDSGDGQFDDPAGIAVDSNGNVYVSDTGNDRVQVFSPEGTFLRKWGSPGTSDLDGTFDHPAGIAIDENDRVFVCDPANERIEIFDTNGNFIGKIQGGGVEDGKFIQPEGLALDDNDNVYVTDTYTHPDRFLLMPSYHKPYQGIQIFDEDGTYITRWGGPPTSMGYGQFIAPRGICGGYVADSGNDRIQVFLEDGQYLQTIGSSGSGDGQLEEPWDLDISLSDEGRGMIYVADTGNNRIQVLEMNGTFFRKWGSAGTGPGEFSGPAGITTGVEYTGFENVHHKDIYVSDTGNNRIQVFDDQGNFIRQWGSFGSGDGQFNHPLGITAVPSSTGIDNDEYIEYILVADSGNNRIQVFDQYGNFVKSVGTAGSGPGQFDHPTDIQVLHIPFMDNHFIGNYSQGNVYEVVDSGNNRIEIIDDNGTYIGEWKGPDNGRFNAPTAISENWVTDTGNDRLQEYTGFTYYPSEQREIFLRRIGNYGSEIGQLKNPDGIATDANGNIYVVDTGNDRVQVFNQSGGCIRSWGGNGTGDGQFNRPSMIALGFEPIENNETRVVYVTDTGNDRVQVFDREGNFIRKWGSPGTGEGQFSGPTGIAWQDVNHEEFWKEYQRIIVSDTGNNRLQVFDTSGNFLTKFDGYNSPHGIFTDFGEDYNIPVDVADTGNNRISDQVGGGWPYTEGQLKLNAPYDIDLEIVQSYAVADRGNHRVVLTDDYGDTYRQVGSYGSGDGQFLDPAGLAYFVYQQGGTYGGISFLYVVDNGTSTVQQFLVSSNSAAFSPSGGPFMTYVSAGFYGKNEGQCIDPVGVAVDTNGDVYVVDSGNDRIQVFDKDGHFLRKWGSFFDNYGTWHNILEHPIDIALDDSGNVYVSDYYNNQVDVFDRQGNLLRELGGTGTGDGQFLGPIGIALDNAGNVYVVDTGFDPQRPLLTLDEGEIQVFDSTGAFLRQMNLTGGDIAIDDYGHLYQGAYRGFKVYSTNGKLLREIEFHGSMYGIHPDNPRLLGFGGPLSIALNQNGTRLYVTDPGKHRVAVFEGYGVTNPNNPPIVNPIFNEYCIFTVNTTVNHTATFWDPDDGDTHTALWDWGDGSTSEGVVDVTARTVAGSHIFTEIRSYLVTLTVTDNSGNSGMKRQYVTILINTPAGFEFPNFIPDPVIVNREFVVTVGFTDVDTNDTHNATWIWDYTGDPDDERSEALVEESAGMGTITGNHTYTEPGVHECRLKVAENDGNVIMWHFYPIDINVLPVTNHPPVFNWSSFRTVPSPITVGTDITATINFTDPDIGDTYQAWWRWGDGVPDVDDTDGIVTFSNGSGTITGNHTYTATGNSLQITVILHDLGGDPPIYQNLSTDSDWFSVTDGYPPRINSITLPPVVPTNTEVTANASFTDEDAGDTHTAVWTWGYGSSITSPGIVDETNRTVTGSHIFTTGGYQKCSLSITDSTGYTGSKDHYFDVFNGYPPVVTSISAIPNPAAVNMDVQFNASFTDEDAGDTHTAVWYYGDEEGEYEYEGIVNEAGGTGTVTGTIRFTSPGEYNGYKLVALRIWDNNGELTSEDILVKVVEDYPPVIGPITVNPASPVPVNALVTTQGTFTDLDAGDTHIASWEWGDGSDSTGTIDAGTVTGTHTYGAEGQYVCKLNVTDSKGVSDYEDIAIHVAPPTQTGPRIVFRDSLGNGIPNAIVQYYSGGWKALGNTDINGELPLEIPLGTYTFRISYGGASNDRKQDIGADPTVGFQTIKSRIELRDSNGAALDPGTAQYYAGGWKEYGTTSVGLAERELLPGNYTFRMSYGGASADKKQDIAINPVVGFTTKMVVLELRNSSGQLIDPGTASYYASGWKEIGPTQEGSVQLELLPGNYTFRMRYLGKSTDIKQDISQNPVVVFSTATPLPTAKFIDSMGNPIAGGFVQYYASGWKEFGTTDPLGVVSKDILPGNYTFRMSYGGASVDKKQDIAEDPLVVFQTLNIQAMLTDSNGAPLDTGTVQYYAGGWKDFGATSEGTVRKDLLPGNYTFRMSYGGASVDKKQDIAADPLVVFQTLNIQAMLTDSNDAPLDTGTVQYYAGGWKDFGSTSGGTVRKDLLPRNYTFRMSYGGASVDKKQDIGIDPVVRFITVSARADLVDSTGGPLDTGTVQYYAGGWKDFGATSEGTVRKDLLPGNYTFRMSYGGASVDKKQDIGINAGINFQTGSVSSDSGTCISYYAGGWKPFINPMDLLPLKYKFRFSDGSPDQEYTVIVDIANHIH